MPKCDACRAEGATQRCSKCQGCWSCDKACAKKFWRTHKKFCTDDPALKPHVPIELAIERALAKEPKSTEAPPENATCYICLETTEGPSKSGDKVTRGCACRGPSAGFAHVDCLEEMASRNANMVLHGGRTLSRWINCPTCHSEYVGSLYIELRRRFWRRFRDDAVARRESPEVLVTLAMKLRFQGEVEAGDRLDRQCSDTVSATVSDVQQRIAAAAGVLSAGRDQEGLDMLENLRPIMMAEHSDVHPVERLQYAGAMAETLFAVGRFREAEPFAVEALERASDLHGPESPAVLTLTHTHVRILAQLGRGHEAVAKLERVCATQTRVLGAAHPATVEANAVLDRVRIEMQSLGL